MLEIQRIRTNAQEVAAALSRRGIEDAAALIDEILEIDETRRKVITEVEQLRQEANQAAKSIGQLMQAGKREEAEAAKATASSAKSDTLAG